MNLDVVEAPWTDTQVKNLNLSQIRPDVHPFTHGCIGLFGHVRLVAYSGGWVCPNDVCSFEQDWAYGFMLEAPE